ncbi:MAG TPA: B12-binding domain/radical SAM domain-containing protein [Stellaceae bacterium]
MALRAVAVAAPDWIAGSKDAAALNSRDPVSLFNACRYAALLAQQPPGSGSAWSASNWAVPRRTLREKTLLMYSLDDMPAFEALLLRERPNLLLIGAMTLCFPGAIRCAERAKELLGHEVLVVLGGRHASETVYLASRADRRDEAVRHHAGSALQLMARGRISPVFDAVISGDGEHAIAALGELVAAAASNGGGGAALRAAPARIDPRTPGDWIVGWLDDHGAMRTVVSRNVPIDYDALPSPSRMFGVSASFDVFGGRMTAHVFSDTGRGCIYDCAFCSERASVTGGLRDHGGAPSRLYRQLREARDVIAEDHPGRGASAFIEDSVMLGGTPRMVERFAALLEAEPLDIEFGGQLTIDQILTRQAEIARLARVGFRYVFIGVETLSPEAIGGMSKDVGRKRASWLQRIEDALSFLQAQNIKCGCAVLFGLGETHESRLELLGELGRLRQTVGAPHPISVNWAVQHPLAGEDGGAGYDYVEWGTPPGAHLDIFHRFGEASLLYPLSNVDRPRLKELREIDAMLARLHREGVHQSFAKAS